MAYTQTASTAPELPIGWRFKLGIVLFGLALIPYGLIAPIVFSHLPLGTIATLTGAGVILQKVMFVSAVAVLGKAGFATLKRRLFARMAPPDEVGPLRYRIGLILFTVPLLQGLLETYASHVAPQVVANRLWVDLLMDVMLFSSVFVLGGNFWDKLRGLFVREARTVFPDARAPAVAAPLAVS